MKKTIFNICITALFAAMTAVMTFIHIPAPMTNGGYLHLGDTFVYLAACFLPLPYAVFAAAIGGGLADGLSGAVMWIIPTVLIKSLMTLSLTSKSSRIITKRNLLAVIPGAVFTVGGYYVAEVIIYNCGWAVPLASVPFNIVQAAGSALLFIAIGFALDKADIKKVISKSRYI